MFTGITSWAIQGGDIVKLGCSCLLIMYLFSLNTSKLSWRRKLKNYPGKLRGQKVRNEVIWKHKCMWQNVNDVHFCKISSTDSFTEQLSLLHVLISRKKFSYCAVFVGLCVVCSSWCLWSLLTTITVFCSQLCFIWSFFSHFRPFRFIVIREFFFQKVSSVSPIYLFIVYKSIFCDCISITYILKNMQINLLGFTFQLGYVFVNYLFFQKCWCLELCLLIHND